MFAFTMRENVERCSGASHGRSFLTRGRRDCFLFVGFWVSQALELVQDSKATIFLVLELARGGELFDRIKVGRDACARYGVQYFFRSYFIYRVRCYFLWKRRLGGFVLF